MTWVCTFRVKEQQCHRNVNMCFPIRHTRKCLNFFPSTLRIIKPSLTDLEDILIATRFLIGKVHLRNKSLWRATQAGDNTVISCYWRHILSSNILPYGKINFPVWTLEWEVVLAFYCYSRVIYFCLFDSHKVCEPIHSYNSNNNLPTVFLLSMSIWAVFASSNL